MHRRYWLYVVVFVLALLLAALGAWQRANAQGAPFDCRVEATDRGGFVLRCEPEPATPAPTGTATATPTSTNTPTVTPPPTVMILPTFTATSVPPTATPAPPTGMPTSTPAPAGMRRVNVALLDVARGDPGLDANHWAIISAGAISPGGPYTQMRLVGGSDGLQIYVQQMTPTAAGASFTIRLRGGTQTVVYGQTPGWEFGERCGSGPASCRGWSAGVLAPWESIGGRPQLGDVWPLALLAGGASWEGSLHWGLPQYGGQVVAGAQTLVLVLPLTADSMLGGGTDCGSADWPDYFPTWGLRNWGDSPYANVQNQWDTADWPCYARYYAAWSLAGLPPGAQVVSATVEMRQFGNPGYGSGYAEDGTKDTIVQVYEVAQPWQEMGIGWDSAPPLGENVSRTLVRPLPADCEPWPYWYCNPGIPYQFDVTEIVKRAQAAGRTSASMALYTAAGQYHSGKYFSSRDGAEPPVVRIAYTLTGGAQPTWTPTVAPTPTATATPISVATATATTPPLSPSSTPSPTVAAPTATQQPQPTTSPLPTTTANTPPCTRTIQPGALRSAVTAARPGDVLCLADGTYTEAIESSRSGQAGKPITVRALNDGKATIDGQGVRRPIQLGHDWWVVEGLVARNGPTVIHVRGNNNVLRRVSAYDADVDDNSSVILLWGNNNLLEDAVAAGTGRYMVEVFQGQGNTLRRVLARYGQWDGRKFCGVQWPHGYNFGVYNASNTTVENVIAYGRAPVAGILVQANDDAAVASNNQVLGSMAVLSGRDYGGGLWTYGTGQAQPTARPGPTSCTVVTQWDWGGQRTGFSLFGQGTLKGNVFRDVLAADNIGIGFSATRPYVAGVVSGNILERYALWGNGAGANPQESGQGGQRYIALPGVQVTGGAPVLDRRYVNGVLTSAPLLPFPMEGRIQAELGISLNTIWSKYATGAAGK